MDYDDYLETPEWHRRRDRSLSLAGWTCSRCPAERTLQVHHLTYERRGEELDGDLVVLCQTCHEGLHLDEQKARQPGVFIKLVSEALAAGPFTRMEDLVEAVKGLAARAQIAYDADKVWTAARIVDANRHGVLDAPVPTYRPPPVGEWTHAIGRDEARALCRQLGLAIPFRDMPAVERITAHERDRRLAMGLIEQEMLESLRRCDALEQALARTTAEKTDDKS